MLALNGYLALASGVAGGSFVEISGGGYARRPLAFAALSFGMTQDVQGGTIGPCTGAAWGEVVGVGIFDAMSAGNLLLYWSLRTPVYIAVGGTRTDAAGTYPLYFPDLALPALPSSTVSWPAASLLATGSGGIPVYSGVALACSSGELQALVSVETGVSGFAPVRSPSFVGTPSAPTPPVTDNSTALATTSWVRTLMASEGVLMANQPIPPNVGTTTDASIVVGTSSLLILPENPSRQFLLLQNASSSVSVFVGFGTPATMTGGSIELQPNGSTLIFGAVGGFVPADAIYAISSAVGTPLTVKVA